MPEPTVKFKKGDRVRLTLAGKEQGFGDQRMKFDMGTVTANSQGRAVKVRPDGHRVAGYWHPDFWELAADASKGAKA